MKIRSYKPGFTVFILLMMILPGQAQNWEWLKNGTGQYPSEVNGITSDKDGNVIITGYFADTLALGDSLLINDYWHNDPFLAKYNANGEFLWAQHFDASDRGDYGFKVITDNSNNIYLIGKGNGEIHFGNETDTLREILLSKFDEDGSLLWNKKVEGNFFYAAARDILLYQNSLLITGGFTNTLKFDNDSVTSHGMSDIFLLNMSTSGQINWLKNFGDTLTDIGKALAVDDQGNIYLGATFEDSITVNNQKLQGIDENDPILFKLNNNGNPLWARHGGSTADDNVTSVGIDQDGNVFFQGNFTQYDAYFSGDTLHSGTNLTETNFLIKYNSNGDYQWGKAATGATSENIGLSLYPDNKGGCLIGGICDWKIHFNGDTTLTPSDANANSTFFAHYNDTGHVDEAFLVDLFNSNSIHKSGNGYYLGGGYNDSITYGNYTLPDPEGQSPVFGVFTYDFKQTVGLKKFRGSNKFQVYPNPTTGIINLHFNGDIRRAKSFQVQIIDQLGQTVQISNIRGGDNVFELDLTGLPKGLYFLKIQGESNTYIERILKQ